MTVQPEPPPELALPAEGRRRLLLLLASWSAAMPPTQYAYAVRLLAAATEGTHEAMGRLQALVATPPPALADLVERADRVGELLAQLVPYPAPRPEVRVETLPPSHVQVLPPAAARAGVWT